MPYPASLRVDWAISTSPVCAWWPTFILGGSKYVDACRAAAQETSSRERAEPDSALTWSSPVAIRRF